MNLTIRLNDYIKYNMFWGKKVCTGLNFINGYFQSSIRQGIMQQSPMGQILLMCHYITWSFNHIFHDNCMSKHYQGAVLPQFLSMNCMLGVNTCTVLPHCNSNHSYKNYTSVKNLSTSLSGTNTLLPHYTDRSHFPRTICISQNDIKEHFHFPIKLPLHIQL
jgi:hypothetical protein